MIILIYSDTQKETIEQNIGTAEYSYYFVLKEYTALLRTLGVVLHIKDPQREVDLIYNRAKACGQKCIFLSFSPPDKTCWQLQCPTVVVFAWEFYTIPSESWSGRMEDDWRFVLSKMDAAITHSEFVVNIIKKTMGDSFPIISAPAPLWDNYNRLSLTSEKNEPLKLSKFVCSNTLDLSIFCPSNWDCSKGELIIDNIMNDCSKRNLQLSGIIYFSNFNPGDGRKNWQDMVTGFISAHHNNSDATLVLKLTHRNLRPHIYKILRCLSALGIFQCRVVLIGGYLSDEEFNTLKKRAHYVVNTSSGEGQCLPLMEMMSMGKPALAPHHTAMTDYINNDNAFIIESNLEPAVWPSDSRGAYRTLRQRINWSSIKNAFVTSYDIAKNDASAYVKMSRAAMESLKLYCSEDVVLTRLKQIINSTLATAENQTADSAKVSPFEVFNVTQRSYLNLKKGMLLPGFKIHKHDKVLNLSGTQLPGLFSLAVGAEVEVIKNQSCTGLLSTADNSASKIVLLNVLENEINDKNLLEQLLRVGSKNAMYLFTTGSSESEIAGMKKNSLCYQLNKSGFRILNNYKLKNYWFTLQEIFKAFIDQRADDNPLSLDQWMQIKRRSLGVDKILGSGTNRNKKLSCPYVVIACKI